tara:strand:+ start:1008 stop:1742 length:735 start_codon:yes stop_codon:yes gene_type:complete
MNKPLLKNFVFFYMNKAISSHSFVIHEHEEENLNYFISSIKKFHPESNIFQCTDLSSPKVKGVDEVFRFNIDQNRIMEGRIFAYSKLNLNEKSIYLDTDMLIIKKIPFELFVDKADVILLNRSFNRDSIVPEIFRGQTYKEHNKGDLGQIYPYIGCFIISSTTQFWKDCYSIYEKLEDNYKFWFGDQKVLKKIVENKQYKFAFLKESEFACPPYFIDEKKAPFVIHFKGKGAKDLIKKYYSYIK